MPLSSRFFIGPGDYDPENLLSYVNTFSAPNDEPSFLWYTGKMWTDGTLVRNKLHAHSSSFYKAFFIAATPEELGLDEKPYIMIDGPSIPNRLSDMGFSNDEVLTLILS